MAEDEEVKKTEVSATELSKVVKLRKDHYNWSRIQRLTNIDRRVCKREYEEWEKYQKIEEREYNTGYKNGWRQGYRQAYQDCYHELFKAKETEK